MKHRLLAALAHARPPLRSAVKGMLPPLVVAALRRRGAKTYKSYAEAEKHSPAIYDAAELCRFRVAKAKLNAATVSSSSLPQGYVLLLAAAGMMSEGELELCDFGGACGEWGLALQRDLPHKRIRSTVVETPLLVAACTEDPFFNWATWAEVPPARCDVFVASGVLQYLPDPDALLRHAFSCTRHFVIITRTLFAETVRFAVQASRLGHNGFGSANPLGFDPEARVYYPRQTLLRDNLLRLAAEHGWVPRLELAPAPQDELEPGLFEHDLVFARAPARS